MKRRPTTTLFLIAGTLAAGFVAATPAYANHGYWHSWGEGAIVEATAFTVGPSAAGSGVARCPSDTRVVGGGIGTTAASVSSHVQVSGPLDETGTTANTNDGDIAVSWYANVFNRGTTSRTYKVFALCSPSAGVSVEQTTVTVGPSTVGTGVATCPSDRRVVGGGIGTTAAAVSSQVQVSGPLDETGSTANTTDGDIAHSWYAKVVNQGNTWRTYKVFALCSWTSNAWVEATTITVAPSAAGRGVATCPSGTRVLGGGIGTTAASVNGHVQVSGPLDETGTTANTNDGDIARSWYANVFNRAATSRTYKVFALCAATNSAFVQPPHFY